MMKSLSHRFAVWRAGRMLRHPDASVRTKGVRILQGVPGDRADRHLADLLQSSDREFCVLALESLIRRKSTSALPAILPLLMHPHEPIRARTRAGLDEIDRDWRGTEPAKSA